MNGTVGVGVYLLLGFVITVALFALFQRRVVEGPMSQTSAKSLAHLTALAAIAEEAHRLAPADPEAGAALPWTPASPLVPMGDDSEAIPGIVELSARLAIVEARLNKIDPVRETSVNSVK
jgi:hypothetical protein